MTDETDAFLARIDAFAQGLGPEEQQMFRTLLDDDDDVVGFSHGEGWPGISTLVSPIKLDAMRLAGGQIANGDLGSGRIVPRQTLGRG